jgi:hypothetical protein
MIHVCLVGLTKAQEWELSGDEANNMGECVAGVCRHYNWLSGTEKVQDWANLIMCSAIVYGGRMKAIRDRRYAERTGQVRPPAVNSGQEPPAATSDPNIIPGVGRVQSGGLH